MSAKPTIDLTQPAIVPFVTRPSCEKHWIRTGSSHSGGDWHLWADLCPWCRAERAEVATWEDCALLLEKCAERYEQAVGAELDDHGVMAVRAATCRTMATIVRSRAKAAANAEEDGA